jgi:hypothetical protein
VLVQRQVHQSTEFISAIATTSPAFTTAAGVLLLLSPVPLVDADPGEISACDSCAALRDRKSLLENQV